VVSITADPGSWMVTIVIPEAHPCASGGQRSSAHNTHETVWQRRRR
jgi:hypothetical protein